MFDIFFDAIGLMVDALKKNPQVRRVFMSLSGIAMASAAAIAASSKLAGVPEYSKDLEEFLVAMGLTGFFGLMLGLAAYAGLRIRGGGALKIELQSLHEERKRITERLAEKPKPDILDTIQLSLNQLNEYYTINKSQARNSFSFSVFAIVVGLATVVGGIWLFYLRDTPKIEMTVITSIAGVLTQFIGAAYFYLYRRSQEQLNFFFAQLVKMQDTMLSVKLCEQVQPPERQVELREKIILTLLQRSSNLVPTSTAAGEKGA